VVAYAPWNVSGALSTGTSEIDVPVLSIGSQRDDTVGTQFLSLHDNVQSTPRLLGDFEDIGHFSYAPIYCAFLSDDGCGDDYMDTDLFSDMMRTATLSWIEHLRGRSGAIEQLPELADDGEWSLVD
jgi:hypothetical protein